MSTEVAVALVGIIGGIVMFFLKWLKEYIEKRKRKKKPYTSIAKMMALTLDTLYKARDITSTDRCLIIKTTNGGKLPKPGYPIYIRIEYDIHTDKVRPVKEDFDGVQMDEPYARLINKLDSEQVIEVVTGQLPEGSDLRKTYEMDKITESIIFYIFEGDAFWYGSWATTTKFTKNDRVTLDRKIRKLRGIFRKYGDI